MRDLKKILNTKYNEVSKDDLEYLPYIKARKGKLTVYQYIASVLGDDNSAESISFEKLVQLEGGSNISLTVAQYWKVFEFKREISSILLENVEGNTIAEKTKKIESMSYQERMELALAAINKT